MRRRSIIVQQLNTEGDARVKTGCEQPSSERRIRNYGCSVERGSERPIRMKIPFGRRDTPQHPNMTVSDINQIGERTARSLDDAGAASRSRQFDLDRIVVSELVKCVHETLCHHGEHRERRRGAASRASNPSARRRRRLADAAVLRAGRLQPASRRASVLRRSGVPPQAAPKTSLQPGTAAAADHGDHSPPARRHGWC